jgi:hypothetical protein
VNVNRRVVRGLLWVILFGLAFAYIESTVVVYLRALYYPQGFAFPLDPAMHPHLVLEIVREAATIIVLLAVAMLAGTEPWERFGYFLTAFGVWDLFYYVWLRVAVGWPVSVTDWDVLFLIPLPWIGPVIAPVLVAVLMIVCGVPMVHRVAAGEYFRPGVPSWVLGSCGTGILLYSFMSDTGAGLMGQIPSPYRYELLFCSLLLLFLGFLLACRAPVSEGSRT